MCPSRIPLNHCTVVLVNVPMNILLWNASDPQRWSFEPWMPLNDSQGPLHQRREWSWVWYNRGGIGSSMIFWENDFGPFLDDRSGERSQVGRQPWQCMSLCSSSLVLCNSSLACACSSIALREATISAIRRVWFNCVSSWRRSWSAIASSRIRSCSRPYSSIFSLRALMASIICCKVEASPPSDPCIPCLMIFITSNCLDVNAGGVKFYRAPRWAPNGLAYWPRPDLEELQTEATFLGMLNRAEDALWRRGLHLLITPTIKSVRAFKLSICISVWFIKTYLYLGS